MADSAAVTAGTNATASHYNNLRKDVHLAKTIRASETYGATVTLDWSDVAKGKIRDITLTGNVTLAYSGDVDDQWMIVNLIQGGAGGYTLTLPSNHHLPGGASSVPLSATVGAVDTIIIHRVSSTNYRVYYGGFDIR